MTLTRRALTAAAIAAALGPAPRPAVAAPPEPRIWLAGVDPFVRHAMDPSVVSDYMELFDRDAPWAQAATHVAVFKTSTQWIIHATDEQLGRMFADLSRRGIALAVEWMALPKAGGCGETVEGFSARAVLDALPARIRRLGGELRYLAMDEPLWFGHRYAGKDACQQSIDAVAGGVAAEVARVRQVFPAVLVGDIEPFAMADTEGWIDDVVRWTAAYRKAAGEPLAFLHADVDWKRPWQGQLRALARHLRMAGIRFGVTCNGDPDDTTGRAWTDHAEARCRAVESDPALAPDDAVLQTWMNQPQNMLPEDRPGTMAYLVARYAASRRDRAR